jgi:hypothetical protein
MSTQRGPQNNDVRVIGNRVVSRFYRYRAADLNVQALGEKRRKAFLASLINIPAFKKAKGADRKAILKRISAGLRFDYAQEAVREAVRETEGADTPPQKRVHFRTEDTPRGTPRKLTPPKMREAEAPPTTASAPVRSDVSRTGGVMPPFTDLMRVPKHRDKALEHKGTEDDDKVHKEEESDSSEEEEETQQHKGKEENEEEEEGENEEDEEDDEDE